MTRVITITAGIMLALALAGVAVAGAEPDVERPDDVNDAYHPDAPPYVVVGGATRYHTAVEITRRSVPHDAADILYVANGDNLADAIVIGATSSMSTTRMLLVHADSVPDVVAEELGRLRVQKVVFLGGDDAISPAVRDEVMSLVRRWD